MRASFLPHLLSLLLITVIGLLEERNPQIIKLLVMKFSPASCFYLWLSFKYVQHPESHLLFEYIYLFAYSIILHARIKNGKPFAGYVKPA
jgi:hypothetical protein